MSATRALVDFVRGLDADRLSDRLVRQACRAVLDLLGVAVALDDRERADG